mmetsp:Transcript_7009/g.19293  ORF Transcript_7009/g.19293 Transcript_7009/m.19293 type:complete len:157 (-) Transcript_7009:439-909(-)
MWYRDFERRDRLVAILANPARSSQDESCALDEAAWMCRDFRVREGPYWEDTKRCCSAALVWEGQGKGEHFGGVVRGALNEARNMERMARKAVQFLNELKNVSRSYMLLMSSSLCAQQGLGPHQPLLMGVVVPAPCSVSASAVMSLSSRRLTRSIRP